MNIEKVKEALNLAMREHNELMLRADLPTGSKVFEEALAELEKPSEENARIIAIDISLGALDRAEYWEVIVPQVIQQYAESYHAKKCAECIGNLPAFPHRPSRFPESRSGVTTDVDK